MRSKLTLEEQQKPTVQVGRTALLKTIRRKVWKHVTEGETLINNFGRKIPTAPKLHVETWCWQHHDVWRLFLQTNEGFLCYKC